MLQNNLPDAVGKEDNENEHILTYQNSLFSYKFQPYFSLRRHGDVQI